jgi:zinc transporter ZupT
MFVATYCIGLIPLSFKFNARIMKLISTAGVGLLIGCSFIVIIPEGIHTYYYTQHSHIHEAHNHQVNNVEQLKLQSSNSHALPLINLMQRVEKTQAEEEQHDHEHDHDHAHNHAEAAEATIPHGAAATAESGCISGELLRQTATSSVDRIGLSLLVGFILMLLVDKFSGGKSHVHAPNQVADELVRISSDSANNNSTVPNASTIQMATVNENSNLNIPRSSSANLTVPHSSPVSASLATSPIRSINQANNNPTPANNESGTSLYGLLVHSAIDGLALGAISVTGENASLELVVFLAIILHKFPAAFGLASFLMFARHTKSHIKYQLFKFSVAAPATAIATYAIFQQSLFISSSVNGAQSSALIPSQSLLGLCLIFSGGTFLFTVAVHILPELQHQHDQDKSSSTNISHSHNHHHGGSKRSHPPSVSSDNSSVDNVATVCLILGILAPLLFTAGAHHH